MNGIAFLKALDPNNCMPMARRWNFKIKSIAEGAVTATACSNESHENPFGVIQGGFAATVLDIALGLVTISVMEDPSTNAAATTDLVVRYFQPIVATTGCLNIVANVVNKHGRSIVAEAFLEDGEGVRYAYAQSNSVAAKRV